MEKLQPTEYAAYFQPYVSLVPGKSVTRILENTFRETQKLLKVVPRSKWNYSYADDKWTMKEVVRHLIDNEWVFAYRALRFSRLDKTKLKGYDQDLFMRNSKVALSSSEALIDEFRLTRKATVALFSSFNDDQLEYTGVADGKHMSVRAAAFIIAGHEIHHRNILVKRYL